SRTAPNTAERRPSNRRTPLASGPRWLRWSRTTRTRDSSTPCSLATPAIPHMFVLDAVLSSRGVRTERFLSPQRRATKEQTLASRSVAFHAGGENEEVRSGVQAGELFVGGRDDDVSPESRGFHELAKPWRRGSDSGEGDSDVDAAGPPAGGRVQKSIGALGL